MQDQVDPEKITVVTEEVDGQKITTIHLPEPVEGWSSPGAKLRWLRGFRARMETLMGEDPFEIREA